MTRTLLKSAVSLVAMFVAFNNLELDKLLHMSGEIDWLLFGFAVFVSIVSVVTLGIRWHSLLSAIASTKLSSAIVGEFIGLFGNNVFPLRLGEILRSRFMAARADVRFLRVLATVGLERLFDLVVVGGIVGLLLLNSPASMDVLDDSVYVTVGIIAAVAAPFLIWGSRPLAVWLLTRKLGQSRETTKWIDDLLHGRTIVLAVAFSLLIWIVYACQYQAVLLAIGMPFNIGLVGLLLVATVAGFLIPSAPGAIGTYHLAVVLAMHNVYGEPLAQAQLAAILLHLSSYLPSTAIGCLFFLRWRPATTPPSEENPLPTQTPEGVQY